MQRLLCAAALAAASTLTSAAKTPLTIRDIVSFERISDPQASPDGRYVAYVVRNTDLQANKGVKAIWLLDLERNTTRPLVSGDGGGDAPRWSPDGTRLYFSSSRSGSAQIWQVAVAGGEPNQVTALPLDIGSYAVSPAGDMLAVSMEVFPDCETLDCTVARNKDKEGVKGSGVLYDKLFVRHWDSWASGTRSQLYSVAIGNIPATTATWVSRGIVGDVPSKPFGGAEEYTFTPDGRSLIFAARIAGRTEPWSTNFDLYQAPADGSAAPRNLTADNPAWDTMPLVTPDGASLVYLAMQRPGFEADRLRIMVKDLATGQTREVAADWDRSPGAIALSADGKSLLAAADDLGQHPLFSIDLASGQVTKLTGAGHVSGFTVAGDSIILAQNALDRPDDLFRLSASGEMKQLTAQNAAKLSGIEMASYEQFSFDGAGGDRVYGYVMKPAGWSKDRKYPVAFLIHGGPQGSMGNNFHYRWNPEVFAGMGYGVVFIDFHGSTGYGQQFTDSISGDWGGKPLEDLKKGLAHALDEYPWLDGRRACALGASYGGFMVNWIAGNWPEGFRCLVTHDGIFDNRAMYYGTEELWFPEWEHQGPYYENPSAYEKHNPSAHVLKWKTPMLIIHGGQDFRVPVEQGLAAFTAAQRLGVPSEFLYFPDENHWVIKPQNSIQWYDTVQRWMDRWTAAEPR